jgi:hypothetical protein
MGQCATWSLGLGSNSREKHGLLRGYGKTLSAEGAGLKRVCVNRKRNSRSLHHATLCRKTFPGKVRGTADPSATLRFGRDDKGEGEASKESGCWTERVFHHLGWARRPMTPTVGMTIMARLQPCRNVRAVEAFRLWSTFFVLFL